MIYTNPGLKKLILNMKFNYQKIYSISKKIGDSFYVLDSNIFKNNYIKFLDEFSQLYEKSSIGYSYKTNYTPSFCNIVNELGGYAEVVSEMEMDLALKLGVDHKRIIYNGPYKSYKSIEKSLLNKVTLNIDSFSEIKKIESISEKYPNKKFSVGIRCNFNLSNFKMSRFGINYANGDLAKAIKILNTHSNINIIGIHCHFPNRDLKSFEDRLDKMLEISSSLFDNKINYIDLGGGFFGNMSDSLKNQFNSNIPSFNDYAALIAKRFAKEFSSLDPSLRPELILEPGTALVADTMRFVTKVISIKQLDEYSIATVAGSKFNIVPQADGIDLPFEIINKGEDSDRIQYKIAGYTCIESDYLCNNYRGLIEEDDFVIFQNVGSYSIVMKPPFIHPNVPIIEMESDNKFSIVKRQEELDNVFQTFNFN